MTTLRSPKSVIDADNSTDTPLGGGEAFTGAWRDITASAGVAVLVNADATGTLYVDFSDDGGTTTHWTDTATVDASGEAWLTVPQRGDHYRVRYVNDATAQGSMHLAAWPQATRLLSGDRDLLTEIRDASGPGDQAITGEGKRVGFFPEVIVNFSAAIADLDVTETTTGDGATDETTPGQVALSSASSGTVELSADTLVRYRAGTETQALITAMFDEAPASGVDRDIGLFSDTARTSGFFFGDRDGDWVIGRVFDSTETTETVDPSTITFGDGSTFNPRAPHIYRLRFLFLGYGPLIFEVHDPTGDADKWVRIGRFSFSNDATLSDPNLSNPDVAMHVRVANTSGSAATLRTNSWASGPVIGHLGARQPDGDLVSARASGSDLGNSTSTPLSASATFTGEWFETTGFAGGMVLVESDQVSATDGVTIEFSEDKATVHRSFDFTYDDTSNGQARFFPVMQGEYYRVKYRNGGVDQTRFLCRAELLATPAQDAIGTLDSSVNGKALAAMVRAGVMAPDDTASWGNIERSLGDGSRPGPNRGLRTALAEHEVETPIKSLQTWSTNQTNVPATGAVQIAGSPLAERKTVLVKNLSTSSKVVYIGTSSAVTASSGYELAAGEAVALDLDPNGTGIWAISASGTQRVCWLQIGGT